MHPNDLPRVSFWELWNEPNFGEDLAPQANRNSTVLTAPAMYRSLLDAGWSALQSTGHGRDTIVIGNLDARGASGPPGRERPAGLPRQLRRHQAAAVRPRAVLRRPRPTGSCAAARRRPRAARPPRRLASLPRGAPRRCSRPRGSPPIPTRSTCRRPRPARPIPTTPSSASCRGFASVLDRVQRIYGSGKRFPIYNNEYGYITNPPNHSLTANPTPLRLAVDRRLPTSTGRSTCPGGTPRVASTMQYLLYDPNPTRERSGVRRVRQRADLLRRCAEARAMTPTACRCSCRSPRRVGAPIARGLGRRAPGALREARHPGHPAAGPDPVPARVERGVHHAADA